MMKLCKETGGSSSNKQWINKESADRGVEGATALFQQLKQQQQQQQLTTDKSDPQEDAEGCTWLGWWIPMKALAGPLNGFEQMIGRSCQELPVDEFGRRVLVYETERALRKVFQWRHCAQMTAMEMFVVEIVAMELLSALTEWGNAIKTSQAAPPAQFISFFRVVHSLLCCRGAEPCHIISTDQLEQEHI